MAGTVTTGPQKERNKEMRKRLVLTLALGSIVALVVGGIAIAAKPTVVQVGNLKLTFNGGFSPTKLSKSKLTPINLTVQGKIQTTDGKHPPALKEFVLEADRNSAIQAKGLPTCKQGKIEATTTTTAKKACKSAIVGEGTTGVEVEFPEQAPIPIKSKLLLFNGGVKGGTTTIFIHAYLSSPVAAAIVTTVKVKKHKNGRYGIKSVASIPKIAGGSGSVTDFDLTIDKKKYLFAKCPDGHLDAQGEAVFADGTRAKGTVTRPCTPKG
jgi:hypothetical protein